MMFSLDFGVVNLGLTHYGLPSGKELNDLLGNEIARILKRKVAGIEQVQPCVGDVSQVGLRTLDGEEGFVLAPHNQRLRLFIAKEFMPAIVESKIRLVVVKQVELDGVIAGTIEEELIQGV